MKVFHSLLKADLKTWPQQLRTRRPFSQKLFNGFRKWTSWKRSGEGSPCRKGGARAGRGWVGEKLTSWNRCTVVAWEPHCEQTDRQTDRHDWKYYLPTTLLAGFRSGKLRCQLPNRYFEFCKIWILRTKTYPAIPRGYWQNPLDKLC